jgi:CRP-like cAMP-binding protein
MTFLHGEERTSNRILRSLPHDTLEGLLPNLEAVDLRLGQTIDCVDAPVHNLYFIERGFVSLFKTMEDGRAVEIGTLGIEGVTGSNALFGIGNALLGSIVRIPGEARRISREVLRREIATNVTLRDVLSRYAYFAIDEIAWIAACYRLHSLEKRVCHSLLIAHDSARTDTIPLTHEVLALMLATPRTTASLAVSALQQAGYVRYARGKVTITNRAGLEAMSCECYRTLQCRLNRLFGPS